MTKVNRNYLVTMIDESDNAFFTVIVKAARALDAAAHAQLYREDGSVREDDYKVLSVTTTENLQKTIEELNSYDGEVAPRYDLLQFDFSEIYFGCE